MLHVSAGLRCPPVSHQALRPHNKVDFGFFVFPIPTEILFAYLIIETTSVPATVENEEGHLEEFIFIVGVPEPFAGQTHGVRRCGHRAVEYCVVDLEDENDYRVRNTASARSSVQEQRMGVGYR
jgi:hypothetical protein